MQSFLRDQPFCSGRISISATSSHAVCGHTILRRPTELPRVAYIEIGHYNLLSFEFGFIVMATTITAKQYKIFPPKPTQLPPQTTASEGCEPQHSASGRIVHAVRHFTFAERTFHMCKAHLSLRRIAAPSRPRRRTVCAGHARSRQDSSQWQTKTGWHIPSRCQITSRLPYSAEKTSAGRTKVYPSARAQSIYSLKIKRFVSCVVCSRRIAPSRVWFCNSSSASAASGVCSGSRFLYDKSQNSVVYPRSRYRFRLRSLQLPAGGLRYGSIFRPVISSNRISSPTTSSV